jgi:DNA polymerase-3 subunit alpha
MEWADTIQKNAVQNSLFGEEDLAGSTPALAATPAWSLKENLAQEKAALGFYFSGHPYSAYKEELCGIVGKSLAQIVPQAQPVLLAGVIASVRTQMTRRGKMAYVLLDDGTARVDVAVFNEHFEAMRDRLKEDHLLLVMGKVSHDDYSGGLRVTAEALYDLDAARTHFAQRLRVALDGNADAELVRRLLSPFQVQEGEGCPVFLTYRSQAGTCEIHLGGRWKVRLTEDLMAELRSQLQPENVVIDYQLNGSRLTAPAKSGYRAQAGQ